MCENGQEEKLSVINHDTDYEKYESFRRIDK